MGDQKTGIDINIACNTLPYQLDAAKSYALGLYVRKLYKLDKT